jgi:hypothetical protein
MGYARQIIFLKGLGGGDFEPSITLVDDDGFSGFDAMIHYDVDGDGRQDIVFGNADASNGGKNALSWLGGTKVSHTNALFEKTNFQVSPNPIAVGLPLQILLENDFFGTVKFEILSLDGRVLHTFFEEKTDRQLNVGRVLNPSDVVDSAFFIRVSDGEISATRLVLKF